MLEFYIPHRQKGEKIILLLRRHYIIVLAKIIFWAIAATMPPLFYLILGDIIKQMFDGKMFGPILVLFTSTYYLYVWLFAFQSFVDYYLDAWIITNRRIINIEQHGLFARTVSEQKLHRVQDVTSELKGFFSTMFDFGNVYVQTAGENPRFVFKQVPAPYQISKKIAEFAEESKKFENVISGKDKINIR
jgi:uncharacterized membrane protein YdbT with pleckstrin-like domain